MVSYVPDWLWGCKASLLPDIYVIYCQNINTVQIKYIVNFLKLGKTVPVYFDFLSPHSCEEKKTNAQSQTSYKVILTLQNTFCGGATEQKQFLQL